MTWECRVVRRLFDNGETQWAIHEAFYEDGREEPDSITREPVAPLVHDEGLEGIAALDALRAELKRMLAALEKPALNYDEIGTRDPT